MAVRPAFPPLVCIVDFNHARGPEVEKWFGIDDKNDPTRTNDWSLLPFLALPDGSHTSDEELSYFTLKYTRHDQKYSTALFGISCTRHIHANELVKKSPEITRSSVQKAIVAIIDTPYLFARIREKLSAVTKAWFAQKDFSDIEVVEQFHHNLLASCNDTVEEKDQYVGPSLREVIHEYKHQTLVLFKCCLLQPKMIFFGSNCEQLCLLQFALISLIPNLIRNLHDCADPELNTYEETLIPPTSLRTSERASLLAYMGLPLQIFGKGSLFGPYTPLQQLDILGDFGTKSYIAGSTNSLLLQQKDKYSDVLINLDDLSIGIFSPALRSALSLSAADRRWIDFITQSVNETWDEANPSRPNTHGYAGSEDFIRLQFEEYLLALLAAVKYRQYVEKHGKDPKGLLEESSQDPAMDFGSAWLDAWMTTENYRIFHKVTDPNIFDIVEPRHPCAGGLTIEDVQRRVAQQIADLNLESHYQKSRETLSKHISVSQAKFSSAISGFWAEVEAQKRKRAEAATGSRRTSGSAGSERRTSMSAADENSPSAGHGVKISEGEIKPLSRASTASEEGGTARAGITKAQLAQSAQVAGQSVQAASARAGAYLGSWGSWAAERRKQGWKGGGSSVGGGAGAGAASGGGGTGTASANASGGGLSVVGEKRSSGIGADGGESSKEDAGAGPGPTEKRNIQGGGGAGGD